MTSAAERALAVATELADGERFAPSTAAITRTIAIGDLQAHAHKIFAVLECVGALGPDGRLAPGVQLVSMGDHFDFGTRASGTLAAAQVDGARVLRWLCAHAPTQAVVLIGNHDLARCNELATVDDATFAAAAGAAAAVVALRGGDLAALRDATVEYGARFPGLPNPGLVHRDLSAFTTAQRALVEHELAQSRMRLAATARLPSGRPVLLTHAGVTRRELALLECDHACDPPPIAAALEAHRRNAITAWATGAAPRFDLAPLHVMGATVVTAAGELPEGGGLLYHRPYDPDRPGADRRWESDTVRPRKFHPRALPPGLAQVVGHTGHPKMVSDLPAWRDPAMVETLSGQRTLTVTADRIWYQLGIHAADADAAVLYMIDPSLHRVDDPRTVQVLELAPGSVV